MSTSTISSTTSYQSPMPQNAMQQNFQALAQAVQSGNLPAAQQAYATLTQNAPATGASGQSNPLQQAIASIGNSLQSGDLSGAQTALQNTQKGMKAHHGHHHHSAGQDAGNGAPVPASTGIATLPATATGTIDVSA